MQVDVFTLLVAIGIVLLVLLASFLIPLLIQLRYTLRGIDEVVREARRDALPMLHEMRETTERLNRITARAETDLDKAEALFASLGEVGESIHDVNQFLRKDVGRYAGNVAGLWLGFRAASKVLLKELAKQKGGH